MKVSFFFPLAYTVLIGVFGVLKRLKGEDVAYGQCVASLGVCAEKRYQCEASAMHDPHLPAKERRFKGVVWGRLGRGCLKWDAEKVVYGKGFHDGVQAVGNEIRRGDRMGSEVLMGCGIGGGRGIE